MRRVAIFDSVTKTIQATVTCVDGIVTIEGEGQRRESWERGIRFCGRDVMPADGELFLDASSRQIFANELHICGGE